MADQRDLGTAVLNIKIMFEKLNTKQIKSQLDGIQSVIDQSVSKVSRGSKRSTVATQTEQIGQDFVKGFEKGVEAAAPAAQSTVSKVWGFFTSAAKKAQDSRSPSRVTMKLGEYFVEGFVIGVQNNSKDAEKAIDALFRRFTATDKYADQITLVKDELKKLDQVLKDLAKTNAVLNDRQAAKVQEFIKRRNNLKEELRLLQERDAFDKDTRIGEVHKRRADELEKTGSKLQKAAAGFRKASEEIKVLVKAFNASAKGKDNLRALFSGAEQAAEKLYKSFVKQAKGGQSVALTFSEMEKEHRRLQKSVKKTVTDTNQQIAILAKLEQAYLKSQRALEKLSDSQVRRSKQAIFKEIVQNAKVEASKVSPLNTSKGLDEYRKRLLEIAKNTNLLESDQAKLRQTLVQVEAAFNKAYSTEKFRRIESMRRLFHSLTSGVNQFGEQLRRTSFVLRDIGRQMMTMARTGFGMLKPTIEDYINFEQAIVDVLATTGDLNNDLTKTDAVSSNLGKTVLDLAGSFVFSAEEIANVAKQLALAGFSLEQIIDSLEAVIKLAAATGSDLATAGNIVTTSMAVFQLEASEASRVADIFTATVTRSNTNLNQLAEAFKIVAPVAANAGQSIEQTAAGLAMLANAGLRGCYDGETEVLTDNGWVKWSDATIDMIYATVNQVTNQIEYHKPSRFINYHHAGEMVVFKNKQVDLFVTPNHNMYVKLRGRDNYELIQADKLIDKSFKVMTAVDNLEEGQNEFVLPGEVDKDGTKYPCEMASVPWEGQVYCVEVPNNTLIVRRNNSRPVVCGNSIAGTGYARILTQLIEKSTSLDKRLQALGSSFDQIDPERQDFSKIVLEFERLNLSTGNLLQTFDLRAFRALNAILAQGANRLGNFAKELERADRVSEAIASARLNTLSGLVQNLGDAIVALRIAIGSLVSKEAEQLVKFLRDMVEALQAFVTTNKEQLAPIAKFIVSLTAVIGTLGATLVSVGGSVAFLAAPFIAFGAVLASINGAVSFGITLMTALGASFAAAAPIVIALTALMAALTTTIFVGLTGSLGVLSTSIATQTDQWAKWFTGFVDTLKELYEDIIKPIFVGFQNNIGAISEATQRFLAALNKAMSGATKELNLGDWESFGELLAQLVASMLDFATVIVDQIAPALKIIAAVFTELANNSDALRKHVVAIPKYLKELSKFTAPLPDLFIRRFISEDTTSDLEEQIEAEKKHAYYLKVRAERMEAFRVKNEAMRNTIAETTSSVADFVNQFNKLEGVLKNLTTAKPLDFDRIIQGAEEGLLDPNAVNNQMRMVQESIAAMELMRAEAEKLPGNHPQFNDKGRESVLSDLDKQLDSLAKRKKDLEELGKTVEQIRAGLTGGTKDEVSKNLSERIRQETKTQEEIKRIQDRIMNSQKLVISGGKMSQAEVKALEEQISAILGKAFKINDANNPMNEFMAVFKDELNVAFSSSQNIQNIFYEILRNLPKLNGTDITKAELWESVKAAAQALEDSSRELQNLSDAETARLKIQGEVLEFEKGLLETKLEGLAKEKEARLEAVNEEIRLRNLALEATQNDIRTTQAVGFDANDPQQAEAYAARLASLRDQEAKQKKEILGLLVLTGKVNRMNDAENADAIEDREQAERDAITEIAELRLKSETDIQKQIELKKQIASNNFEKERIAKQREFEKTFGQQQGQAEFDKYLVDSKKAEADELAKLDQEGVDQRRDLEEQHEADLIDLRLETETEVGKRIALLQKKESMNREKERREQIEQLSKLENAEAKIAEFKKLSLAAEQEALRKINEEEMEKANKEKDKTEPKVEKKIENRLTTEQNILDTLTKQVQTLAQAAQLMRFMEVLQKRKDTIALQNVRKLNRERRKLADLEAKAAGKGRGAEIAARAIQGQKELVALAEGRVFREKGIAGALLPDKLFDVELFFANLRAKIADFRVELLQMAPLIIPAKFDFNFMIKDLTKRLLGFNIGGLFAGIIPQRNFGGGDPKANQGAAVVHNDNRRIEINVENLNDKLAKALGMV